SVAIEFEPNFIPGEKGQTATLKVQGTPIRDEGSPEKPGVSVTINIDIHQDSAVFLMNNPTGDIYLIYSNQENKPERVPAASYKIRAVTNNRQLAVGFICERDKFLDLRSIRLSVITESTNKSKH